MPTNLPDSNEANAGRGSGEQEEEEEEEEGEEEWYDDDDFDSETEAARYEQLAEQLDSWSVLTSSAASVRRLQPQDKLLEQSSQHLVDLQDRRCKSERRLKDKADRATTNNCLDQRTLRILFKLIQQGVIADIEGCISSGKEANVYYAHSLQHGHLAVKVYMTSVMPFKHREKYMKGDRRLRHGVGRRSWKKVSTWAEKEYRNLLRVAQGGVPAPRPLKLKGVVLLMSLIGTADCPAPKLKDADPPGGVAEWTELYWQLVGHMRTLYQQCRLVHADLSEYNILYSHGRAVLIDFSQSVEHEHPQTFAFLRADCRNVNAFFRRQSVPTLTQRELFEFVTDIAIEERDRAACLLSLRRRADDREGCVSDEEDAAFESLYIPRRLEDVPHYERCGQLARRRPELLGDSVRLCAVVSGMRYDLRQAADTSRLLEGQQEEEEGEEEEGDNDSSDSRDEDDETTEELAKGEESRSKQAASQKRPSNETTEERRRRKLKVKEERRERRKTKVPKAEKKRQAKLRKK